MRFSEGAWSKESSWSFYREVLLNELNHLRRDIVGQLAGVKEDVNGSEERGTYRGQSKINSGYIFR